MQENNNGQAGQRKNIVTWLAACAAAVVFLVVSMWIGFKVFAVDYYAGPLKCYAALALISVAATAVCEAFFDVIDGSGSLLRRNHFALMTLAGLLLTAVYGPQIFIKFYEYDDWIYIPYLFGPLDWGYISAPINNHYVPLLRPILYYVSKFSAPTYYGNAVVFYLASMLVLTGLGRVVKAHVGSFNILALAVISFAIWPSFEASRIAFDGGFWLALPVATFLGVLLAVRRIYADADAGPRNYVALALLGTATVLVSSQILIPLLYVFAYSLPYWNTADPARRSALARKGLAISAILLVPTVLGFLGRRYLAQATPDLTGLFDGAYFTNLALFVKAKVGFEKISTTVLVCLVVFFGARALYRRFRAGKPAKTTQLLAYLFCMAVCGLTMPKMGFNEITTPLWIAGLLVFGARALHGRVRSGQTEQIPELTPSYALMLCGLAMLLFYVLQVGVGRRWGISTALADYYAMFPLTACWLFIAGTLSVAQGTAGAATSDAPAAGRFFPGRNLKAYAVAVMLCAVFAYSLQKYLPTSRYVELVVAQKVFVRDIGLAACSEARTAGADQRLFVRARLPFTRCKSCGDLLRGPERFVSDMSEGGESDGGYFQILGKVSAMRLCPDLAGRLVMRGAEATLVSDGQSEETNRLYRKYFE